MEKNIVNQQKQYAISFQPSFSFSFILLGSVAATFAMLWYWKLHASPLIQPDSGSYIEFSPIRTIGYPFLLEMIKGIFGTLKVMPIIHLLLLTLSATYLASVFYDLTKNYFLAFLLIVGLMVNPAYEYAFNIMTEPIAISLLMIFMGITIRLIQGPTLKKLTWLSAIAGLAILVRPVHYAYIPVLVLIGLALKPVSHFRFRQIFMAVFAPLIVFMFLGCMGQYWKNGIFRLETMGAFNMIGKVALIAERDISVHHPSFLEEVATFSAPVQKYLNQTPNFHIRYLLSVPYYDYFRYTYLGKISNPLYGQDLIYRETSWDIIKSRPLDYLRDVWINFCALWQLYDLLTIEEKNLLKTFLDSHQPSPYLPYPWYPNMDHVSLKHHPLLVWSIRGGFLGIAISGLIMVLGAFISVLKRRSIPPLVFIGSAVALLTQGHFMLTALVQAGLPRYSFSLWPAIVLVGIVILEMGRQRWKGHFS